MVSFYGRNPEFYRDHKYVEDLYFIVNGNQVSSGYEVFIEYEDRTIPYQLTWFVGPDDATNKTVEFSTNNTSGNVEVSQSGLVIFRTDESTTIFMRTTDESLITVSIKITIKPASGGGELPL